MASHSIIRTLGCLVFLSCSVHARIGDSQTGCSERYGNPISSNGDLTAYKKSGIFIICQFVQGKCESISYMKEQKDDLGATRSFSQTEIDALKDANGAGQKWQVSPFFVGGGVSWETDSLLAVLMIQEHPLLKILTKSQHARDEASKAAKEKEKLKGF